ncbi:Transposase IS116/IS110/IS902 family protein [Stieleria maiorica]|uniref:Transposase IS116/IS110/IS902 family protein n=1 Tax=Stieleria maiorica TaxID=2795974 RepID=A0A5B9M9L7_9BACT|nr:Transposase IS116/IS110/IS902 family protein [Stieleria maiorica]QEF97514.1 Transposase IS116/IS110/IS902 family protein [Stieleria maiorica]
MSAKRRYRRTSVKKISLETLKDLALEKAGAGTCVGLDIGKNEIVAVVRWADGAFECPWSVKNPSEITELIGLLKMLRETGDSLTIGLESTGTYGEVVRAAMTATSLEVHRISGKASSDYKEIFDGVPSQHDGKDAAIIAELTCFGKGTPWPFEPRSETNQEMRYQLQRLDVFDRHATEWCGRLEAVLAAHWPELSGLLSPKSSTLINIMLHYGSPARLAADVDAAKNLRLWGGSFLGARKIDQLIDSARTTQGVPVGEADLSWIQEIAKELKQSILQVKSSKKRLETIAQSHAGMSNYVDPVGAVTLCMIWSSVGDPRNYDSSGAFLKSLGLNLKELSSGKRQGQLGITKRGPSLARKFLYLWAMRALKRPELQRWYLDFQKVGRSTSTQHRKMKGLVALMRKLSRSLWYVCQHDQEFDYAKVFPGRPLEKRKRRRRNKRVAA